MTEMRVERGCKSLLPPMSNKNGFQAKPKEKCEGTWKTKAGPLAGMPIYKKERGG